MTRLRCAHPADIAFAFFVTALAAGALLTMAHLIPLAFVQGPNTVGEAGKVYYAHRFQLGESIFLTGESPPYYPAFHGALLHSSVGAIAALLSLPVGQIYFVGRIVSVLCLLAAALAGGAMLVRLGLGRIWLWVALGLFLSPHLLHEHAVSYRPETWVLALTLIAALLLTRKTRARWEWCLLVLMPVIAFFIKAPGVIILPTVALWLWLDAGRRAALIYAASATACLALGLGLTQWLSDGAFLDAFGSGMQVSYSPLNVLVSLNHPAMWPALLFPLAMMGATPDEDADTRRLLRLLLVFWFMALLGALATATRVGSNIYYFLIPYAFGVLLFVYRLARALPGARRDNPQDHGALAALLWITTALLSFNAAQLGLENNKDVAVAQSERFGPVRASVARWINSKGWRCYSDDPGLNVLLDKPMVIFPIMQGFLVEGGRLTESQRLAPIEQEQYDIVVLTGMHWSHRGMPSLPDSFWSALREHYEQIQLQPDVGYIVLAPKSRKGSVFRDD
jgi:hypothetical protein